MYVFVQFCAYCSVNPHIEMVNKKFFKFKLKIFFNFPVYNMAGIFSK